MSNRAQALLDRAADCGERVAIHHEGQSLTFHQMARQVLQVAGALQPLGIAKGTHVGILLPASPQFVIIEQALFAVGAPVTPVNILYRPNEVAHAIKCCDLRFMITTTDLAAALEGAIDDTCSLILVDADENHPSSLARVASDGEPLMALAEVGASDPVFHLLTSATTGKAKGVILTAGNLAANYDRTPEWLGLDRSDTILCALPLYNTFGLNQCINAMLVTGATMVLLSRFDAEKCISATENFGCTFLPAVPTMLQKIVDDPAASPHRLASLRTIMTGGAPVPSALLSRLLRFAPDVRVLTGYGLTEATALVTLTEVRLGANGEVERGRTIGQVLGGMELAVVDDDATPMATGQSGEFVIRGPNLMAGYYNAPDDTAAALRSGWLHTGDIGFVDDEGYATIVDRKKDVIIRGGQNIYPIDIEEVLYAVDGVAEAAVVARHDDMLGEVPIAFVAAMPGRTLDAGTLLDQCRLQLARYKVPAAIEVLAELPKGPTGKILRRALRDQTHVHA
jgi:long-chain acyl-CoA synthetase